MSNAIQLPPISPLQSPKSLYLLPSSHNLAFGSSTFISDFSDCSNRKSININGGRMIMKAFTTISQQGSILGLDSSSSSSSPVSIELKPILSETQFDLVIAEAQQLDESLVILWMAKWCRKCIYLKPKLEKLAADYHPRVKFYCIDVNNVPYKLVVRAGVTKMPTIQLWKDSKKHAEVIGGHKAYLVVNEVREMIENEDEP